MPTIAPRLTDSYGNVIVDSSGNHITTKPAQEYTGPPAPANVKYDPATGDLSWDAVTSATSYKVYASDPSAADPEALALLATVTALTYSASVLNDADRRVYAVSAVDEYVSAESNLSKPAFAMGADRRL